MMSEHWASVYIGKPWSVAGVGPDDYYCWGLIQDVAYNHYKVEIPNFSTERSQEDHVMVMKQAGAASGWRHAEPPMLEDDIVLMRNTAFRRHVGIAIRAGRTLGVMHASGGLDKKTGKPFGSVVFQTLDDLSTEGFFNFEFWRNTARG